MDTERTQLTDNWVIWYNPASVFMVKFQDGTTNLAVRNPEEVAVLNVEDEE